MSIRQRIPEVLRNPQRSMYNYALEREKTKEQHDQPSHTGRNIGIAAVLVAGVLIAPSAAGEQGPEPGDSVSYELTVED